MYKTPTIIIWLLLLNLVCFSQNTDQNWTKPYQDPVELAQDFIKETNAYWTPVYKGKFIRTTANFQMPSEKYSYHLFFQSPYLIGEFINKNNYKNLIKIEKTDIENIIDQCLREPKKFSERVAKETLKVSIYQYNIAYKIARQYLVSGRMTNEDALIFLENRWSILKMVQANSLLRSNGTYKNNKNYEDFKADFLKNLIESKNITTQRIQYLSETIGPGNEEKFKNCAHFGMIIYQEVMMYNLGISAYEPYKQFKNRMDYLNRLKIDEIKRLNMFEEKVPDHLKTKITKPNSRTTWNFDDKHMKVEWHAPLYDPNKSMNIILWKGKDKQILKKIGRNSGSFEFVKLPEDIIEGYDYYVSVSPQYITNYEKNYFAKSNKFSIKKDPAVSFSVSQNIVPVRKTFGDRSVKYIKEITVPTKYITIEAYDHAKVDGDMISLYLNGKVILYKMYLRKQPFTLKVELEENIRNDIFLYAHNLGDIPPNTVALKIKWTNSSVEEILQSDLQSCEAVVIRVSK